MVEHYTVWICTDCMMLLANGEVADDVEQEPMALLDGEQVTPGLAREEHECLDADGRTAHDRGEECECEDRTFSHSTCEGCGGLPGHRHGATVWPRQDRVNELFGV